MVVGKLRYDWLPPFVVLVALLAWGLLGWRKDVRTADLRVHEIDRLLASVVAGHLRDYIHERAGDLRSIRQAWLAGDLQTAAEFHQRASGLRANHPEYSAVYWAAPNGAIVWSDPAGAALSAPRLQPSGGRLRGDVILSPTYPRADHQAGFQIAVPVRRGGGVRGLVLAELKGSGVVLGAVPPAYRGEFNVYVAEERGIALFGEPPPRDPVVGSAPVTISGPSLVASVWPTPQTRVSMSDTGEGRELVTNGLLAVIVAAMLLIALRQRRTAFLRAEEVEAAAGALKASERRVRDIVEQSPWVVIEHAPDGTIDYSNPAAERLYKLKAADMNGHSPVELIHPDDVERTMRQIHGRFTGAADPYLENRNVDADGSVHYMRWTGVTRYGPRGEPNGSISFGQDITTEVEAERVRERLAAEEQRVIERLWVLNDFARSLRTTLDTTSLYQIAIRAVANVLAGHHCAILVYSRESETFEVAAAYSAGPDAMPVPALSAGTRFPAAETNLTPAVRECRQLVTDDLSAAGSRREAEMAALGYVSRAAVPILVDNLCIGLLAAYARQPGKQSRDSVEFMQGIAEHLALALTNSRLFGELKSAYTEVREAQAQLVQMEKLRAVGEMASGIAHDFNNSLAAVIGYAELLAEEDLGPQRQAYVDNILKASHDAAATVRRIQQYSRRLPEPDTFGPVDVNALVHEAATLTRHRWRDQAQSRGVTINIDMDLTQDMPPVRGNVSELREVFTNLIFNAVDAMPRGGRIRILSRRQGSEVLVDVADTGTGMSNDVMAHMFEPFYTTKGREGNGLGLSVSYGIVRRHGGDIRVTSAEGRGSTFEVTLPVSEAVRESDSRSGVVGFTRSTKALVIDDDPAVSDVVSALLRKLGHSVVAAANGDEGLEILAESRFDVVFTDLGMPGMNGREVALAVKRAAPETAVVLLTGWGEQFRSAEETPEGVDIVLSKPVRLEQLREALEKVCAGRPELPSPA